MKGKGNGADGHRADGQAQIVRRFAPDVHQYRAVSRRAAASVATWGRIASSSTGL